MERAEVLKETLNPSEDLQLIVSATISKFSY